MERVKLSLRDKGLFDAYLRRRGHELSSYAFESIYLWKGLYDISWVVIEDALCIFFQDALGCFLYLAPLGSTIPRSVIDSVFEIMDTVNRNRQVSRIENVEEPEVAYFQELGYTLNPKPFEYLYKTKDLAALSGNKFKSQRACCNYFVRQYRHCLLDFSQEESEGCLQLFDAWSSQRKEGLRDSVYQGMLDDSRACLSVLLEHYADMGLLGRVVKIDGAVKAFTFGFRLNDDTFCILSEITDLGIKGLAQFIFREFCRELSEYEYINIMDDSGLPNLKRVKHSYHPFREIPNYIVTRG